MNLLKILLTVHQFLPEYFSGTEILTYSVAQALIKAGHEVCVFTGFPARTHLPDAQRFDTYDLDGMKVHRFYYAHVPMGEQAVVTEIEYDNRLTARYFTGLLESFAPDLVHFFHLSRLGSGLIDATVSAAIPAFYTPTDFWSVCPTSQLLLAGGKVCAGPSATGGNCVRHVAELTRGAAVKRVSKLVPDWAVELATRLTANGILPNYPMSSEIAAMSRRRPFVVERLNWLCRIISPTKLMTGVLTANGVEPKRITQSAYGIDMQAYNASTVEPLGVRVLTIGFIGTLAPHKGCHVLIEAFRKLDVAKVRLKIYGNLTDFPDYVTRLRILTAGANNIDFCGTFPNAEVANVIATFDLLVVPSLWYENTPLVVYSALAAKRPVIASHFPGLAEAVTDGENGLLFEPGNVQALVQGFAKLLVEPNLIAQLSQNCRPPKSSVQYVDELLAIYAQYLGASYKPQIPQAARLFEQLEQSTGQGYIAGWAVIANDEPALIEIIADSKVLSHTTRFLPRPDVKASFARQGVSFSSDNVGFVVSFAKPFDRNDLKMRVSGKDGVAAEFDLGAVAPGSSTQFPTDCYVGIDQEQQPQS